MAKARIVLKLWVLQVSDTIRGQIRPTSITDVTPAGRRRDCGRMPCLVSRKTLVEKPDPGFADVRGLLFTGDSSEQSRIQRRSVVTESTTIIAFDQHAQSVVAAVLEVGASEPAVQALAADLPSIGQFRGAHRQARRRAVLL